MGNGITVAVLGATGRVGREMLAILESREFPCGRVRALASARSAGSEVTFRGKANPVEDVEGADLSGIELALFSAGSGTSKVWAPRFAEAGALVVDNSSCWRMDPEIPLVVPEVNMDAVRPGHRIIANPNCSTIPLVMVLDALRGRWGLERVVLSTYQAVSGAGEKGVREYEAQRDGRSGDTTVFGKTIHENVVPWIGKLSEAGYTDEELKARNESRKILGVPDLKLSCTCVRVPVVNCHSESVNVRLREPATLDQVNEALQSYPGLQLLDDPEQRDFPTPRELSGRDEVFIGRIRPDDSAPNAWALWLVSDNVRKGAALNAVQIAEGWLKRR
jgi:aspartate-semialdehyde dehydrogenase